MGKDLAISNVNAAGIQTNSLMDASMVDIAEIQAGALVTIARIQDDIARSQAYAEVEVARIQADSAIIQESIRLHSIETRDLISSASASMSKALDIYGGVGAPRFMESRVKSKLSGFLGTGLFGKSCTITVETRCLPNYYLRGPVK